jgi:hypothetical protein
MLFGNTRGEVKLILTGNTTATKFGSHQGIVLGIKYNSNKNEVVSIGADSVVKMCDPREAQKEFFSVNQPKKPITMT